MLPGIDVSYVQQNVDWPAVAGSGQVFFTFIRASYGTAGDVRFAANWSGARAAGLPRGAYHYFLPDVDPRAQTWTFLAQLGRDHGELPFVLDVEELRGRSPAYVVQAIRVWLQAMPWGSRVILYGSPSFLNGLPLAELPRKMRLWVANYGASTPEIPRGWPTWTFWQYGSGTTPGIEGPSDLDAFNGALGDLRALTAWPWWVKASIGIAAVSVGAFAWIYFEE